MNLCPNGKLVTLSEELITTANNFTYVYRVQKCEVTPQEISPVFFIVLGILFGVWAGMVILIVICSRRRNQVEPLPQV